MRFGDPKNANTHVQNLFKRGRKCNKEKQWLLKKSWPQPKYADICRYFAPPANFECFGIRKCKVLLTQFLWLSKYLGWLNLLWDICDQNNLLQKELKPWYGSTYQGCYIILTNNGSFGPCNEIFCYVTPHPKEKRKNNSNDNSNSSSRDDKNTGK